MNKRDWDQLLFGNIWAKVSRRLWITEPRYALLAAIVAGTAKRTGPFSAHLRQRAS
jgi:hypothetical protein